MMRLPKDSFRWISSIDFDVDAYRIASGDRKNEEWFLFIVVKSRGLSGNEGFLRSVIGRFKAGRVVAVGGALKLGRESKPFKALFIDAKEQVAPAEFWAVEAGLKFRLETEEVLNPGLFLDQKKNRERLRALISQSPLLQEANEHKGFLNLFSYTGAFSIAALAAGARRSTSVDLSKRYLGWEKRNYNENKTTDFGEHRLINEDARDFLKKAQKRGDRYAWIVLDPPTFSRGKRVFKVRDDLIPLVESAYSCLTRGGAMLVSTNDSGWPTDLFNSEMKALARRLRVRLEGGEVSQPLEEDLSHAAGANSPGLKSVWLLA
ncbi:MAG: class I SAM-dependent methyltransferase [Bdellovibrionota bacterium]